MGYQAAGPCAQGPQPGARALMAWWLTAFADRGAVNSGIFNCRVIAGSPVVDGEVGPITRKALGLD